MRLTLRLYWFCVVYTVIHGCHCLIEHLSYYVIWWLGRQCSSRYSIGNHLTLELMYNSVYCSAFSAACTQRCPLLQRILCSMHPALPFTAAHSLRHAPSAALHCSAFSAACTQSCPSRHVSVFTRDLLQKPSVPQYSEQQ